MANIRDVEDVIKDTNLRIIQAFNEQSVELEHLRDIVKKVKTWIDVDIASGIGCPFCKDNPIGGEYVDGEYWHHSGCLYEKIK